MRFILGAQKVHGRCAEGAWKVHGRCTGGTLKVCGRWVMIGNLKLKACFEVLNPL